MSTMTQRLQGSAAFAGALVIGAAIGIGGASLALWSDAEEVAGAIGSGYESFAVGAPGSELTPAAGGTVQFGIDGPAVAGELLQHGAIAIPIQVDTVSQGNKGLQYTLTEPDWGDHILGQSEITVFWVEGAEACEPGATPGATPDHVDGHTSAPITAAYTDSDMSTEYWCLQAALGELDDEGTYTNIAEVTATDPSGAPVEADDDWSATVTTGLAPEDEESRTIKFTYTTFRPGEMP